MGIACALGALLAAHLTASGAERAGRADRAAAALLAPIAVTLYLTFSRGAIWVLPVGLVLYVLLAQPRGLLTGLPAAGIPAAIAVKVAYGADLLARADYDASAAAASQGRDVALVVLVCALGGGGAAGRRAAARRAARARSASSRTTSACPAARARPAGSCSRCCSARWPPTRRAGSPTPARRSPRAATWTTTADLRTRLTSAVDNGRIDNWRVALDGAEANLLKGTGAGHVPAHLGPRPPAAAGEGQRRPLALPRDAVGAGRRRARARARRARDDPGRRAWSGSAAPSATRTARSSRRGRCSRCTPASTGTGRCRCCSCGCSARAAWCSPRARRVSASSGRTPRIVAALAVLVLAITPALFACSQPPLDRAVARVRGARLPDGDRRGAGRHRALRRRGPEPWQILGYCDARVGQYELARRAMDAARARDPDNWQLAYGQAIVYGVSGLDARPFAAEALRLEPARRARPRAGARPRAPRRRRPAGVRSRGGP